MCTVTLGGAKRLPLSHGQLLGALAAFSAAAIWGGMYVVSKYVLAFVPPLTLVALRLAIAALVLTALLALGGGLRVARRDLPRLALCGAVGYSVSLGAQFVGTRLSTAHDGALITSATPAFIALFARVILGERVTVRRWLAIGLATAGVLVVATGQGDGPGAAAPFVGNLLLVAAALTWALYSVLVKAALTQHSALVVTTYATLAGLLFTAPVVPFELAAGGWPAVPDLAWWGVLYLGIVSTAAAAYLWSKGFELLDASVAALFFYAQPVIGGLLSWLLLGESLPATFFVGAAAIASAVILASRPEYGARRAMTK